MSLFLMMLPVYLLGNLHCIGMCGPLVAMLGRHPYRYYYFLGRTLSFTLAGWVAGSLGAVLTAIFSIYHLSALTSLLFGSIILLVSLQQFGLAATPTIPILATLMGRTSNAISLLLLTERRWPTFLFGLSTILLPCGQTVIVYSACALVGDPWVGLWNGLAFALLTSPSLFLAMHLHRTLPFIRKYQQKLLGTIGILVALLTLCRGFADLHLIPHWVLYTSSDASFHLAVF